MLTCHTAVQQTRSSLQASRVSWRTAGGVYTFRVEVVHDLVLGVLLRGCSAKPTREDNTRKRWRTAEAALGQREAQQHVVLLQHDRSLTATCRGKKQEVNSPQRASPVTDQAIDHLVLPQVAHHILSKLLFDASDQHPHASCKPSRFGLNVCDNSEAKCLQTFLWRQRLVDVLVALQKLDVLIVVRVQLLLDRPAHNQSVLKAAPGTDQCGAASRSPRRSASALSESKLSSAPLPLVSAIDKC